LGLTYGLPSNPVPIVKYDPIDGDTSIFEEEAHADFSCKGNGTLGRNGCIYALAGIENGRVLEIDTTNNSYCFVGNRIQSDHAEGMGGGWGDAILGIDGCIYWPPFNARRTLKYDPYTDQTSLVGDDFGRNGRRWISAALASDGVIYCIPRCANRVLVAIDPLREFSVTTKTNMEEHPEELGFLFRTNDADTASNQTYFDCAVTKFGIQKVLEIMEEHMPPANEVCAVCGLYPFMIAASY